MYNYNPNIIIFFYSDDVDFNTKEIRNPLIQRTFQVIL